jgi:hypothetical protein
MKPHTRFWLLIVWGLLLAFGYGFDAIYQIALDQAPEIYKLQPKEGEN